MINITKFSIGCKACGSRWLFQIEFVGVIARKFLSDYILFLT